MLPRTLTATFAVSCLFLGSALPAKAQGVPPVGPSSPIVQITSISINPQAPPVGTNYTVTATFYSRHNRSLLLRGAVQVPGGDVVLSSVNQDRVIGPGGYVTFTWNVYCGVNGGTVRVKADILRELR